jgi:hypothetical protein
MTMRQLIRSYPVGAYFAGAYLLSAVGVVLVYGPAALAGPAARSSEATRALVAFPMLVVGVGVLGLTLTGVVGARGGLRTVRAGMGRWRVAAGWYAALLLPPVLILTVLFLLRAVFSPVFTPRFFVLGVLFGVPAGVFEELGWTAYAWPRMSAAAASHPLVLAVVLGLSWGLWHLPVVDHLGAASPHGVSWLPFFLAFIAVVTGVRVLIVWVYANTGSILLAQLIHISSTGSLVVFSPGRVSAAQEALWYGAYAVALWVVVAVLVTTSRMPIRRTVPSTSAN